MLSTRSRQGSVTAPPVLSTATTGLPVAMRASIRAFWFSGSSMWARSKPSLSQLSGRPTMATTTSAPAAARSASSSSAGSAAPSAAKPRAYT